MIIFLGIIVCFGTSIHAYCTTIIHFIAHDHQLPAACSAIILSLDMMTLTGSWFLYLWLSVTLHHIIEDQAPVIVSSNAPDALQQHCLSVEQIYYTLLIAWVRGMSLWWGHWYLSGCTWSPFRAFASSMAGVLWGKYKVFTILHTFCRCSNSCYTFQHEEMKYVKEQFVASQFYINFIPIITG